MIWTIDKPNGFTQIEIKGNALPNGNGWGYIGLINDKVMYRGKHYSDVYDECFKLYKSNKWKTKQ